MLAFWFSLTEFGSKQVPGCPPQSPHTGVLSACALATRCATNPHSDPTAIAWGFGLADAMEARHAMVNILLPFGFVGLGDSDSDSGEGCNDDGHFGDECDFQFCVASSETSAGSGDDMSVAESDAASSFSEYVDDSGQSDFSEEL